MNIKILFSVLILAGIYTNIYSQDDTQIGSLGTKTGKLVVYSIIQIPLL